MFNTHTQRAVSRSAIKTQPTQYDSDQIDDTSSQPCAFGAHPIYIISTCRRMFCCIRCSERFSEHSSACVARAHTVRMRILCTPHIISSHTQTLLLYYHTISPTRLHSLTPRASINTDITSSLRYHAPYHDIIFRFMCVLCYAFLCVCVVFFSSA